MTVIAPARPDFKIYTAGLETESADRMVLSGVGSSTIVDLERDQMELAALDNMIAQMAPDMTIFRNHSYSVPEDVVGSLNQRPTLRPFSKNIVDLVIGFDVDDTRTEATQIYRQVSNGVKIGISCGVIVDDYELETTMAGYTVCHIKSLRATLEMSTVGLPANQRSWVEHAIGGAFTRSLDPALAPIAKSLLPHDYARAIAGLSADAQEYFTAVTPRPQTAPRIVWYPSRKSFALEDVLHKSTTPITPAELDTQITASQRTTPASLAPLVAVEGITPEGEDMTTKAKAAHPDALGVTVAEDGTHEKCMGLHTHSHSAHGDQGSDGMHEHEHSHDGNAAHAAGDGHTHDTTEKATEPGITKAAEPAPAVSDSATALITDPVSVVTKDLSENPAYTAWHAMGKQLGFLPTTKAYDQDTFTLISAIDGQSDEAMNRLSYLCMMIDDLMQKMGIPDLDGDVGDGLAKSLPVTRKAGRAISDARMKALTIAHHLICNATGGAEMCKAYMAALQPDDAPTDGHISEPTGNPDDAASNIGTLPGFAMGLDQHAFQPVIAQLDIVAKALGTLDVQGIAGELRKALDKELLATKAALAMLATDVTRTRKELGAARTELAALTTMPLGNPTALHRTVQPGEAVATYQDFAALSGASGLAGTTVKNIPERGMMRHWPAGVGPRPALESWQDAEMSEGQTAAYLANGDALVPEKID